MTIDVGATCITRGSALARNYTYVGKDNPANATGIITTICVYSLLNPLLDIKVATFNAVGNSLTTRQYVTLGDQGSPGQTTYIAPSDFTPFEVRIGDYIGIYYSSWQLYTSGDGGGDAGIWYLNGDYIPCTSQTFDTMSLTGAAMSLYATGFQLGQINIGDVWKDIQNIQINVGDQWRQIDYGSKINIGDVWKDTLY